MVSPVDTENTQKTAIYYLLNTDVSMCDLNFVNPSFMRDDKKWIQMM